MTRVAVAKHLRFLEGAGLVVTKRRGREKLHFLNTVPIRLVHDRWVSKYTEEWTAGLAGLKHELEHTMEKVFEIYIRTTPERLWEAITDPDDPCQVPLWLERRIRLDDGSPFRWCIPVPTARWPKARTWKSTRPGSWSSRCRRYGARKSSPRAPDG